jgi:ParB family transcriptional regulator, chromosome partitioning protein
VAGRKTRRADDKLLSTPSSDLERVVAQGKENSERRDLSFIERAAFAIYFEQCGFEGSVILAT